MNEEFFKDCLFKFAPFNVNSLKIIINKELWFGEPDNQNDPNEGEFVLEGFENELTEEVRIYILKEMYPHVHEDWFRNNSKFDLRNEELKIEYSGYMRNRLKKEFGICSFSKTHEEILLWSHYSNSHKGLCFVFNKDTLIKCLGRKNGMAHSDVTYMPDITNAVIDIGEKGNRDLPGHDILKHKYINFKYEDEYRFIYSVPIKFNKERTLKYDPKALKAVVFGEKMNVENKRTVVNLIASSSEFSNVEIWISKRNNNNRENKFELIHDKHPDHHELFKDQGAKPNYVYQGISRI
jgi:hypothetical protein